MGETWGCIYKTAGTHHSLSHLVFTCMRRHGITSQQPSQWWIPLPREMSILENKVEGDIATYHLVFFLSSHPLAKWTFVSKWHEKRSPSRNIHHQNCEAKSKSHVVTLGKVYQRTKSLWWPDFCQPSLNGLWTVMLLSLPLSLPLSSAPFSPLYLGTVSLHSRCTIYQPCSPQKVCNS